MGLFDLNFRKVKAFNTNTTYQWNGRTFVSPDDNAQTYIEGYKKLPNLYGIISLITQKSSIVPFQPMRIKSKFAAQKYNAMISSINVKSDYSKILKVKEQAFEEVENSEIEKLLLKPNGTQSMEEFNEAFDGYLLLTGNAYIMANTPGVGVNAKKPQELHVLPSTMVEPIAEDMQISHYKVSYLKEELDVENVAHAKYFNPILGTDSPSKSLIGMSPLTSCRSLIKRYEHADIAQGSMFLNMGPAGILNGENGDLTEPQAQAVQDKFDQNKTGMKQAGKISITPVRLHWTQIGLSPVDLNIIESKKEMLSELCNIYKVDIGIATGENSTDNNMDNARKRTITDAVIPTTEKRKQIYNNWLAPKFGGDIILVPDYSIFSEMQEDIKEQAETANLMWWITGNEKRELTGYDVDSDPNMNKKYIQSSLIPLDDANLDEIEEVDEEVITDVDA